MVISRSLTTKVGFAELHCLSNYSFLSGASHPEELVEAAAQKGYRAIALTDECTYSGLVKAHMAAKRTNFSLMGVPKDTLNSEPTMNLMACFLAAMCAFTKPEYVHSSVKAIAR